MLDRGVALVTGGASGIGLAAARLLLHEGWRVLVADLLTENLDAARESLTPFGQDRVQFARLDVCDETEVVRVVTECDRAFGPIRGLVNSAGIGRDVPFLETSTDLLRKLLEVNLVGTFVVAREVTKCMRAHGGGAVVNIASVSGIKGNHGRSAYGASKGGVITLTQVMAVELAADRIRVNAVAPGPIETPLVKLMHTDESRSGWMRAVPQRRYAAPEEVAGTISYLLDEVRASFVTGQTICVDGGFTAAGLVGNWDGEARMTKPD